MQKEKFIPQVGFLALSNEGKLDGFLEEHLEGHPPEEVFRRDQYRAWWRLSTGDRYGCIQTLIEAYGLGLLPEEREWFLRAWNIKDADSYEFAKKARVSLLISGGGYRASIQSKQDIKYFAVGVTPFMALCKLWIVMKTTNHGQAPKE